jgi:hypothetical protein
MYRAGSLFLSLAIKLPFAIERSLSRSQTVRPINGGGGGGGIAVISIAGVRDVGAIGRGVRNVGAIGRGVRNVGAIGRGVRNVGAIGRGVRDVGAIGGTYRGKSRVEAADGHDRACMHGLGHLV